MTDSHGPTAKRLAGEGEEANVRYLDEVQDEAYRRSSFHGDARVEAEFRLPVRAAKFRRIEAASAAGGEPENRPENGRPGSAGDAAVPIRPFTETSQRPNASACDTPSDSRRRESESRSSNGEPYPANARPLCEPVSDKEPLSLSGIWKMKSCDPADPGDPVPFTGWFGRRGKDSPGMAEKWYRSGFDRSDWDEVSVPSTVQKALIGLGQLPDPHWDTNTLDELERYGEPKEFPVWFRRTRIERQDWWLAKTFPLPETWRGRRLTLRFGGLDYSGSIFLNGQPLGHHAGMFGGPDLDITGLARFGEEGVNELVVRIDQTPQSWNGKLKGSPGFGWHYGHLISLGIWRDVIVTADPDVSAADPYVTTQSIGEEGALLRIEYALDSLLPDRTAVEVELAIRPLAASPMATFPSDELRFLAETEIEYGLSRFSASVILPDPALWWPNGYGEPSLYELAIRVSASRRSPTQLQTDNGASPRLLHQNISTFGVRTIEMKPAPGAKPEAEYRWQFVVNGVPMFVKGANWCWPDPLLEQDEKLYERLLELARRGGVQMLRAWGGGLVESDFFYRTCDEKGIMVYQEFPLCWGPPDSPYTDLGVLDRQVARSVKRLRSRPSLVMWGGGNENGAHGGADEGLFLVGRRCRGLDPSRPFHRTDPWGGSAHNWDVYHGGEPLEESTLGMPSVFYGEYGIPSQPNRESCLRYMPPEELEQFPPTEESRGWKAHFHQFGLKDVIKVMRYAAYGPIASWDDYILYSQSAQGDSIAFTGDSQRAGSGRGKTGFWYYKFTELFPGHSWGVVDFYGVPKLSYYRAKQTCLPRSAYAVYERAEDWAAGELFRFSLHVSNDTREKLEGAQVEAVLYDASLEPRWRRTWEKTALAAGETVELVREDIRLPDDPALISPFLLAVSLRAEDGARLSDRWYAFNGRPKTEELLAFERERRHGNNEYPGEEAARAFALYGSLPDAPLRRLPETRLEWNVEYGNEGGVVAVRNVGGRPAYRVMLEGFPSAWDGYLEDNDFGLHPGEERRIPFEMEPGVTLDGLTVGAWNAPATGAAKHGDRGQEE